MIACAHVTTCCSFTKSQKLWISDLTEQISIPNLQSASFYLTKLTPPMGSPTEIDEHGSFPNPIGRTNEQAPQLQTVQFGVWRNFRIIPSKSLVEIVKPLFPDAIGNYGNLTGKHKLSLNTWTETIIMNDLPLRRMLFLTRFLLKLGWSSPGKKNMTWIFHRVTPCARFTLTHFSKYSKAWHYGYGMIHDDLELYHWLPSPLDHIKSVLYGFPKSFPINMPRNHKNLLTSKIYCFRSLKKSGPFQIPASWCRSIQSCLPMIGIQNLEIGFHLHLLLFQKQKIRRKGRHTGKHHQLTVVTTMATTT